MELELGENYLELELIWLSNGTAVHKGLNSITIILRNKQKT